MSSALRATNSICGFLRCCHHGKPTIAISHRYFADITKPQITNAPKFKTKKRQRSKPAEKEVSYEEESDLYLLKELRKAVKAYTSENREMLRISNQFADVLRLYHFEVISSPINISGGELSIRNQKAIHLTKQLETGEIFDLVLDAEVNAETESRDAQVLISNNGTQLVYLNGLLTRDLGLVFDSAMILDTLNTPYNVNEIRGLLRTDNFKLYKLTHSKYLKLLASEDSRLIKFITTDLEEIEDEFDGRLLVDSMLNFVVIDSLGIKSGTPEGDKLKSILWMYASYMENALQGQWLSDLTSAIEPK